MDKRPPSWLNVMPKNIVLLLSLRPQKTCVTNFLLDFQKYIFPVFSLLSKFYWQKLFASSHKRGSAASLL